MSDDLTSGLATAPASRTTTPTAPALAALIVAVTSILLALFVDSFTAQCLGYALGGVVAPSLVAAHRSIDNRRSGNASYVVNSSLTRISALAVALTLIGACYNAWLVATELAKR